MTKLFNYRKKYNVHPTNKILAAVLRTELESHKQRFCRKQVRDYFARICISSVQDEKNILEKTSLDFL